MNNLHGNILQAERSDISVKPNPYKLLYAFEIHRHKWRKAATFIYKYSNRLKGEMSSKDHQFRSLMLLERLNALSATINALHLVDPAYAWIDSEQSSSYADHLPSKRARIHDHKLCKCQNNGCWTSLQSVLIVKCRLVTILLFCLLI